MRHSTSALWNLVIRSLAWGACILMAPAWSQDYPVKPVRILVPFPAGGGSDLIARLVGQKLTVALGQAMLIENRAGASGNIAAEIVAKAAPDGYTLLFGNSSLSISPAVFRKLAYDPVRDLAPISMVSSYPFVLVSHPSLPVRDVRELIVLARKRPQQLDYASSGAGTMSHLAMELFRLKTGVKFVHLPFKGAAPALTGLLTGEGQFGFLVLPVARTQINVGKLRGLGVAAPKRSAVIPQVPTMEEAGVAGRLALQWNGFFAPDRTTLPILERLYREVAKAVSSPDIKQRFEAEGAEAVGSTPAAFASFFRTEAAEWADVAKRSGTKLD